MELQTLLEQFHYVAANPAAQKEKYLSEGQKVVLTAPIYTPEEIIHAMGLVPMGAWGGNTALQSAKQYFPAFICSIVQSMVELGMRGVYHGVSAIVIPSLCDSLKVAGENWKYAVPSIPFIPMTYPQNRKPEYARAFTLAGYQRVIADLEKATGAHFTDERLEASLRVYNEHNAAMRKAAVLLGQHPKVLCAQRSDVFKSAFFMRKEEHTALLQELISALRESQADEKSPQNPRIFTTGILADAPAFLTVLDACGLQIAGDDIAAESRQYRTDAPELGGTALARLAAKFSAREDCSVLYDAQKSRVQRVVNEAKHCGAQGVLLALTKFCDPEEFDAPLIQKACETAGLPCILVEVDRQMDNYEQARTAVETLRDMLL